MNRRHFFAIATVFTFALTTARAAEPLAKDINWASNLQSARTRALQTDKPMLIVFGADWCGYCKKLEKTTLSHAQMVKYINARFVPVHIDYDKNKKIAGILEVETLPCSVILSPSADLLGKAVGYQDVPKMYQTLTAAERLQERIRQTSATR